MVIRTLYLAAVAVAFLGSSSLGIYWLLGTPEFMQNSHDWLLRFLVFAVVPFGLLALLANMLAERLTKFMWDENRHNP